MIGVIYVFRSTRGQFSQNDLQLLQSFADQAAVALQNAMLFTEAAEEKRRMDALLDSVADGILILTPSLTIERVNPARVRDVSEDELIRLLNVIGTAEQEIRRSNRPRFTLERVLLRMHYARVRAYAYTRRDWMVLCGGCSDWRAYSRFGRAKG